LDRELAQRLARGKTIAGLRVNNCGGAAKQTEKSFQLLVCVEVFTKLIICQMQFFRAGFERRAELGVVAFA
jgi:hypothetical protein